MIKKNKGQGVVEYAGAIVCAAVLVGTVLLVGPDGIATLFTDMLTQIQEALMGELDGAFGGGEE